MPIVQFAIVFIHQQMRFESSILCHVNNLKSRLINKVIEYVTVDVNKQSTTANCQPQM